MNHKGFHHLTLNDRLTIEKMLKVGCNVKQIASAIGCHYNTIYNELKRGRCQQITSEYEFVERYAAEVAERKYREHLKEKGPDLKLGNDHAMANYIEDRIIYDHFSPGAVLAEIREKNLFQTRICESTLYNYIYGGVFLVLGPQHLHEKGKRHEKKETRDAARASAGESIEKRPVEIWRRQEFGHWEMDSVMGAVGTNRALVVLTERKVRYGLILPVPDHTAKSVVEALDRLERKLGDQFSDIFKTITVDNGTEFSDCEGLQRSRRRRKKRRTTLYYCHPYSPNERGSNENMNRLIRRFFPKGTNFDEVALCDIQATEDWINDYPRKLLGWKTARTLFNEELEKLFTRETPLELAS